MFYAQGIRATTSYKKTAWEQAPIDLISIDTADPYLEVLGSSYHVVKFNDSTISHQCPYGTRDKNVSTILAPLKCFVADSSK